MTAHKEEQVENAESALRNSVLENIRVESPDDWLRETKPVYWDASKNAWILTRHSDIGLVLRDSRFSVEAPFGQNAAQDTSGGLIAEILQGWLVFKNPPEHTRLRQVLQGAFMSRPIEMMRPSIQAIANEALDKIGTRHAVDLIEEYAVPVPATVISDLCGAKREHSNKILRWAVELPKAVLEGQKEKSQKELANCVDFFRQVVDDQRVNPGQNITSVMIKGGQSATPFTDDEIISTLVLILIAGHETTAITLANGIYALLRNPSQLTLLEQNKKLIPRAVEEFMRFDGPVSNLIRIAHENIEIGGQKIKKFDRLQLSIYASGHDPEVFQQTDFDITRQKNQHMAFGKGIHLCLGAPLARLMSSVALEVLLDRYKNLQLQPEALSWNQADNPRRKKCLPVLMTKR